MFNYYSFCHSKKLNIERCKKSIAKKKGKPFVRNYQNLYIRILIVKRNLIYPKAIRPLCPLRMAIKVTIMPFYDARPSRRLPLTQKKHIEHLTWFEQCDVCVWKPWTIFTTHPFTMYASIFIGAQCKQHISCYPK